MPRRASSKAWRPKPAPTSSTRLPGRSPSARRRSKRIVSIRAGGRCGADFSTLAGMASTSRYCSTVMLGAAPPRPPLEHPLAPGGADAGPQLGVVETAGDRRRQRLGVAGRARQHGVAVAAGDLGQRAAVGGDERRAGDHRLDGRQAEALVEARHDGQLGLGVELDDALVGARRTRTGRASRRPSDVDQVHALAGLRLADDRQRDVALGAQLGRRLEQVGQALQRDVGRRRGDQPAGDAGDRPGSGRNRSGSTPTGTRRMRS